MKRNAPETVDAHHSRHFNHHRGDRSFQGDSYIGSNNITTASSLPISNHGEGLHEIENYRTVPQDNNVDDFSSIKNHGSNKAVYNPEGSNKNVVDENEMGIHHRLHGNGVNSVNSEHQEDEQNIRSKSDYIHSNNDNYTTENQEKEIKEDRERIMRDANAKMDAVLEDMKQATNGLLANLNSFLKESESVAIAYIRTQASQQKEARRLEEVEPDVSGATTKFLHEAQQRLGCLPGGSV
mmetsp:Transcript_19622/g.24028  ORF Transcript_19622/g.24028 Transcript_19622/m.24028 type:complete len:238 (-) Transcript_19622:206-919(-)